MPVCALEKLKGLLLKVEMRRTAAVEYSPESAWTLWDGGDRVEERTRRFYVTLRHFDGDLIGRHVGLSGDVERLEDEWGERRTYRLPAGAGAGEHLSVYVYNPAVCANGTLPINISTTDEQSAGPFQAASVAPDTCEAVFTFGVQSMQKGHVTRLVNRDDNYLVELRILYVEARCHLMQLGQF